MAPALFAYKEVPNEPTGFSPIELLYGRAVWGPMHILKESWVDETDTDAQNAYHYNPDLKSRLADTCRLAQAEAEPQQIRYKKYYDREVVASTVVDNDVADEAKFLELPVASSTNITELEQKHACELISLLNKYSDVFSDNPGNTNLVEHKIDLISDEPVHVKPYPSEMKIERKYKKC